MIAAAARPGGGELLALAARRQRRPLVEVVASARRASTRSHSEREFLLLRRIGSEVGPPTVHPALGRERGLDRPG